MTAWIDMDEIRMWGKMESFRLRRKNGAVKSGWLQWIVLKEAYPQVVASIEASHELVTRSGWTGGRVQRPLVLEACLSAAIGTTHRHASFPVSSLSVL